MIVKGEICLNTVYVLEDEMKEKLSRQGFGTTSMSLRKGQAPALVLMDEEAMYMASRGLLDVSISDVVTKLWTMFCGKNKMFPYKYKTYTYFKENGYTVKSGTNFGMDYSVYRLTPHCSHSEFCVRVTNASGDSGNDWRSISTVTRVMPDVMKICILSVVTLSKTTSDYLDLFEDVPPTNDDNSERLHSMNCLNDMDIRLLSTIIRRLSVTKENYLTIGGWQSKYRKSTGKVSGSSRSNVASHETTKINRKPSEKKHQRKRRNHLEIRSKEKMTKSGLIWEAINSSLPISATDEKN